MLDEVAKLESIEVAKEELEERIRIDSARMGEQPEKVMQTLRKQGRLQALKNQLVREKALDLLVSVANIQNEES